MTWVIAACGSALFAGIVSILAKLGMRTIDSDVATAIRTGVVFVFSLLICAATGALGQIVSIDATALLLIVLSGFATGASWLCYFKALSVGDVNKVTPVDKSSIALSILLAIVFLGETSNLGIKLTGCALILIGTLLMIERRNVSSGEGLDSASRKGQRNGRGWLFYAILSAVFAALVAVISKLGFQNVDSNLGTAIRTVVVLVMAWGIVIARGKVQLVSGANRREMIFVLLSGVATGASWLCYFYAIQNGVVSAVVPIDKLSIVVSIAFSYFVLREPLSLKAVVGLCLIVSGTLLMTIFA